MRFFEIVVSGAALISSGLAVTIDTYPTSGVEAGKSYTITYSPKDAPATFVLRKGASGNLDTVGTIGTGTGGSFTWSVDKALPNDGSYALEVKQGSEINYSGQFPLSGGSNAPASASSVLASASSALSSAASAASSAASSIASSAASAVTSSAASVSAMPSSSANSTVSTATLSRSASPSASRPASTTGGSPPQSTGAASMLSSSPVAILFGAIAAFAYLN
ncbi:hypothetical protein HBI56_210490 [Parastagonospora nodorum]|uniref:Yeast cell wall synthesis Kre9/Knh1-like N-terminal domain-containing protein n=2 Tax=Phaeosphaeria nodorum (strain SN15 / ATCC MYA-4574 / FGSC 10173) TaxID=321614 RepID=Q0TZ41_PHANO|nr:hypothetical protein SNOG_15174 [Parastagonospora nodorum SN15]KAH3905804.1 hypothetical protein HBH56_213810 [Parastagonospora nodorum]EAT77399.1 hypothetical protein SNOG_15174 [Parastagonospora nodorum SN15]KAH3923142.1 hypothetical protein HBH54_215480 [Parastagonospora nodorum]KAH3941793.1 hypothetical protein HBH53_196610 [Parastagonospora nodorum]KAH3961067.1 hypothetical protein HBH51_186430 [Parastagonospora nodorum]